MKLQSPDGPVQATTPVRFADTLPDGCDVTIIGGGVIGIFAALYMARAGIKVAVCEKGRIAGEQSSRNWGWIRQHGRDEAELPIMMEASRLWEEADRDTGNRTGFQRRGVTYLASSQKKLDELAGWLDTAREHQLDTRVLSKSEVDKLIDRSAMQKDRHQWVGATHTASDGRAEPWMAVPAVAELARKEGVTIREDCAVRGLDIAAGRVRGVVTEAGRIACEQVIVAAGAWSSLFLQRHGINIPQLSVRSTVCQSVPLPEFLSGNAGDENISFRRREDGGYTLGGGAASDHYIGRDSFRNMFKYLPVFRHHVADTRLRLMAPKGFPDAWSTARNWADDEPGPFEAMRVLNPKPNLRQIEKIRNNFSQRFPDIGKPEIRHAWAGMIDAMPDIVPIVDRVPSLEGLVVATGMSGHGFGIAPGFGRILAAMVQNREHGHDIGRFRFSRFTDGSPIVPGPDL